MSKYDEQIIVVPRDILFEQESNAFNGFLTKMIHKVKRYLILFLIMKLKDVEIWKKILHINN